MLRNGLYNVIGAVIRIGLTLLTIPLLIRMIGVEEYGLWILASAVIGVVTLAEAGLSISTTVFVSRDLANGNPEGIAQTLTVTLGGMLVLATLAALGLWMSASMLANFFPNLSVDQRMMAAQAFQVGAWVVWARLLQQVLVGVEQAYQRYGVMNVLNTAQSTLSSLGLLAVAGLGGRSVALMQWQAAIGLGVLMAHGVAGWLLLRRLNLRPAWNRAKAFEVARYSGLTWLGTLGGVMFSQCDRLVVGALLGPVVLGIYAAITNVTVQINTLSALPVQPLLPALSSLFTQLDTHQQRIRPLVRQALQVNAFVAWGIGAALFTFAPVVMRIIIPGIVASDQLVAFRVATVIYALYSLNAVGYYALFAIGALREFTAIQLTSGIVALLLIALGARILGLLGAVAGNVGYLGVWLFTWLGMARLQISAQSWSRWLWFPLVWFCAIGLLNLVLPDRMSLMVLIAALQGLVLLGWFVVSQRASIQHVIRNLVT